MNRRLAFFTDLDGTLLDHHDYSFKAALPALQRLQQLGFPVILNSSKTLSEMFSLQQQLQLTHPLIAENGSAIFIPADYWGRQRAQVHHLGRSRSQIVQLLNTLRQKHRFKFSGFSDLDVRGIAQQTGLSEHQAELASQRECSEPLSWHDDDDNLHFFQQLLQQHQLTLTRGGRFYHVMSQVDKGQAMQWLLHQYPQAPGCVALGDAANDVPMLKAADIAVLISNPDGSRPDVSCIPAVIQPLEPGPAGWNSAVFQILKRLEEE